VVFLQKRVILLANLRNILIKKQPEVHFKVHEPWLTGFQANFSEDSGGPVPHRVIDLHRIGRGQIKAGRRGQTLARGRGQTLGRGETLARREETNVARGRGQTLARREETNLAMGRGQTLARREKTMWQGGGEKPWKRGGDKP
jgi:hypothetical protein